MLAHLLRLNGIESVVVEAHSRQYVEQRVRAACSSKVRWICSTGPASAPDMTKEGSLHHGIELGFHQQRHRIDMTALTGNAITVYAQHEVVKDLIQARIEACVAILFHVAGHHDSQYRQQTPLIQFEKDETAHELHLRFYRGMRRLSWHLPPVDSRGYFELF